MEILLWYFYFYCNKRLDFLRICQVSMIMSSNDDFPIHYICLLRMGAEHSFDPNIIDSKPVWTQNRVEPEIGLPNFFDHDFLDICLLHLRTEHRFNPKPSFFEDIQTISTILKSTKFMQNFSFAVQKMWKQSSSHYH